MSDNSINFDANASHGLLPCVIEGLRSMDLGFGNPSSIHTSGQKARALIEQSRHELELLLGLDKHDRLLFTSGATESNNTCLQQVLHTEAKILLTSPLEHPSIIEPAQQLKMRGVDVIYKLPKQLGNLDLSPSMLSLMYANNETGQIFDCALIAKKLKLAHPQLIVHCDAVQALGKIDFSLAKSPFDLCSFSAHKIGGLAGVGAIAIKAGVNFVPSFFGGPQEKNLRAGTENVIGIYSFGLAAKYVRENSNLMQNNLAQLKSYLIQILCTELKQVRFTLDPHTPALCNTISFSIPGLKADDLLVALDLQGIRVSSGAACSSGKPQASHVLLAMGIDELRAKQTLRVSLRFDCRRRDIELGAEKIISCVRQMKEVYGYAA